MCRLKCDTDILLGDLQTSVAAPAATAYSSEEEKLEVIDFVAICGMQDWFL
jgi:hypothetical protein